MESFNNRKKFIAWDHFEKVQISEGHFKGNGTTNLLVHVLNCLRNPNRDALKAQQTLPFKLIIDGEERFWIVLIASTVEAFRNALTEMVIIYELLFRFVEWYRFQRFFTTLQPKLRIGTSHLIKL